MDIFPQIKGEIEDYDVIVIGHLKWNKYFGEGPDAPPRGDPSTCTSTLVKGRDVNGERFILVIDPTLRSRPEDYYFDINRRTGLYMGDVTHCYSTHEHMDHQIGLSYFPNAKWLAAKPVAEALKNSQYINGSKVLGVQEEFLPGVYALHIPGHTYTLHGVAFMYQGMRIVATGDGVMTKSHFIYNTTAFEKDAAMAAKSILNLKDSADIIIPGHDNLIINNRNKNISERF